MIRQATTEDLEQIMQIYAYARSFMAANGNPTQWGDSYPPRQMIEDDIKRENCMFWRRATACRRCFVLCGDG